MSVSVAEYYAGKRVFLTGVTGLMGKVLVEKLLRSCPQVDGIYILMREKKGQGTKERLKDLLSVKLFDRLRSESPSCFDKLHVVSGDILLEDLGMSAEDREELQREAQIVFHCAACVRFDLPLRDAVNINTTGTKKVLDLAEGMKKLEVFIYMSTAYSRCELEVLEEKVYPSKHRPQDVMECCRWMDDDLLKHMETKLCNPLPNTYAYTKSLAEDLVSQYAGKFPIAIARPSIVVATLKEPMPGWVDNLNGPTGLMVGAGKGVIRSIMMDSQTIADGIPVDMACNGCIVLAYTIGLDRPREVRVSNITQSGLNPLTWGRAVDLGRKYVREFPSSVCLWYPAGSPTTSWLQHQIAVLFTQILPAYFLDLLLYLTGHKTFMVKVQKKINYGMSVLQYYTVKSWTFKNDKYLALRKRLSKEDDDIFYTDTEMVNWDEFMRLYIKGAREYCLKEDPATLPQARRLLKQLFWLDIITKSILCSLCAYLCYKYVL